MNVISIDPGAVTGYAIFQNAILRDAGHLSFEKMGVWLAGPYYDQFATSILPYRLIVERPGLGDIRVPHEDLITLALRAGTLGGAIATRTRGDLEFVTPGTWKGQLPKPVSNARTLQALSDPEIAWLPQKKARVRSINPSVFDHNMLDAIGIGLWACGRSK